MNILLLQLHAYLDRLGIPTQLEFPDRVTAACNGIQFVGQSEQGGYRLECRLWEGIPRNKVTIWNIVHQNNYSTPFGQFYISPDNRICFGLWMDEPFTGWLESATFYLLHISVCFSRLIRNDFSELAFDEYDHHNELYDLFTHNFENEVEPSPISPHSAAVMMQRMLNDVAGPSNVIQLNEEEQAVTDDFITNFRVEQTPMLRKIRFKQTWHITATTEVGILQSTDSRFWIRFNRLNYSSFMLSYTVRYVKRQPMVLLRSELVSEMIQHPDMFRQLIQMHNQAGQKLLETLHYPYRIRNLVDYKLGL